MTTTMCSMPESSGGGREAWPKLWANASALGEPVAPTTRATPDAPAAVKRKSRRLMRMAVTPFWIYLTWTPRDGASDSGNVERDSPKQSGKAGSEEQLHAGSKQERNPGNRSLKGVPCQTVLPYRKEIVVVFLGGFDSAFEQSVWNQSSELGILSGNQARTRCTFAPAFVGTNAKAEPITSRLPVTRPRIEHGTRLMIFELI